MSAVKKRYYLDFNITVRNRGLVNAGEVILVVSSGGDEIKEFDNIEDLTIFSARTLTVRNLRVGRFDEEIVFNVSMASGGKEIDAGNNVVVTVVDD